MKDIKLTIEEIKKGCEFAEGFYLKYDDVSKTDVLWHGDYCVMFLGEDTPRKGLYFLFLQRVIEGINKKHIDGDKNFNIDSDFEGLNVWRAGDCNHWIAFKNYSSIDQAKTQAIKYILDKL